MKFRILLALVLAPLAGIGIGLQLYQYDQGEDPSAPGAATPAHEAANDRQTSVSTGDGSTNELAFTGIAGANGAYALAPELKAVFEKVLVQAPGESRHTALRNAFVEWVLQAPEEAFEHLGRVPREDRPSLTAAALAALAEKDPQKFQRYATWLGKNSSETLAATLNTLAGQNPAQALKWIKQNPGMDSKRELTKAILPELIRADVNLAAQTVAGMRGELPVALVQQVASAYAKTNPDQAYRWIHELIKDRNDGSAGQLLNDVSSSLAAQDPAKAADYMNRTADSEVKKSLMSEIAVAKSQDDVAAAWTWLNQYNNDPVYPDAAMNLVYRWSYARPQDVANVLPTITDPGMQAQAATHLARQWHQQDRNAFQQWVASLPPGNLKSAAGQY